MKTLIIFLLFLFAAEVYAQDYAFTQRKNNYVREGAGSYYSLVEILPVGQKLKVLERSKGWLNVLLSDDQKGWIAENCVSDKRPESDYSSRLIKTWSSAKASKSGLAAAIKGLKGKSLKTVAGDVDLLLKVTQNKITRADIMKFKSSIEMIRSENRDELSLDDLDLEIPHYDPSLKEQQSGIGIASRLVSEGVYDKKELQNYLNLIAAVIVENSRFYDWDFNVILLKTDKIEGYACPGGYIFITKGALMNCTDESELAAIIAHEIAHIIRRHGLQEMTQRIGHIKADEAFAELEEDLGDELADVEDLENMIVNSYNKVVHERLLEYELEADKIAAVLCANTGYDPFGVVRINQKLSRLRKETKDIFDDDYLSPDDLTARYKAVHAFCEDEFSHNAPGARLKERFLSYIE